MSADRTRQERAQALEGVRECMGADGIDFYLVPSADAHQNEYVPACWQRRAFISGFDGSAGDVLIGGDRARLWTDSRYHLQAEKQIDSEHFELMRQGLPEVPAMADWLGEHAVEARVGVDARVVSVASARRLREKLEAGKGALVGIEANYVDAVWTHQPPLPEAPAHVLDEAYAGESVAAKLTRIRAQLEKKRCAHLIVPTLDAIAWTLNLRGRDVAFNPLLISYLRVSDEEAVLYVDARKLEGAVASHLKAAGVDVEDYDAFGPALEVLTGRVWIDPKSTSLWVAERLQAGAAEIVEAASPVDAMKAVKNEVERAGMAAAHVRDGAALVRFLHWLEGAWGEGLDELGAAERLERLRSEGKGFQGLSFPTISGFAGNGAIVHYGVSAGSAAKIDDSALYLVDSGAQYLDGTTDVTRTVHLGTPTPEERLHYTLVLRGHLALRHARFPKGTSGAQLDSLARAPLWREQLDYGHGTGHGVGHYLNVHEGPQSISPRGAGVPLEPGMVVSNEPGLYLANRYGIRIENLVVVVEVASAEETGSVPFYGFDDLTMVPYCRGLIDLVRLEAWEREAIDAYHHRVRAVLEPTLSGPDRSWLRRETAPLA